MERWRDRVAVVTGASSGIGTAIARELVKSGLVVVALGRRLENLEAVRAGLPDEALRARFHPRKCDVTDEAAVRECFEWIDSSLGGTDVLVNNAGCQQPGQTCIMAIERIRQVIDTNLMGVIYCTQAAFRSMKARDVAGHVLLINSIVGHHIFHAGISQSTLNVYPATKYAITALTEIYRQEFDTLGTKIKITSISPGLVDTEMVPGEIRAAFPDSILNPEDIASAALYAIGTPPHVQVHELTIKPLGEKF